MENIQNLSMDIMDNHIYEIIYTKQYDEGRTIIFNILENGKSFDISGYKAIFQMKKPDGTVIINDYDVTNGKIAISLTNQMTICAGNKIPFQIQLIKNIEDLNEKPSILTTVTGYIKVDKSVVQPDDAVSSDEFNALTHALTEVNKIHVEINNAEKVREANESIRENNETVRISNETSRNNTEEIRKTNENIRISSETIRSQNEETRQANENIRKSNETARQSDTADAITQANTATKNCVDATTDLQTKLSENYFVLTSDKGIANGVAELDQNGLVPSSQLPGYVDDVVEGYFNSERFYKDSALSEEIPGETGKIYVDLETNKTYRWSGNTFIVISETLALGETSSTAYRGDKGKAAYEHSLSAHAMIDATKTEKSDINGNIKINNEEKLVYKHPVSGATPGSYGDVVDQAPNAGESFKVPFISVDDAGHITEVNDHTITLPKSSLDGDTANNTISYTSEDNTNPTAWTDVSTLTSGEKHSSIFNKISKMCKNVRYLWKLLGTTDISSIGGGTVTGAINSLNGNLANVNTKKQDKITGAASTVVSKDLMASMAVVTSPTGKIGVGNTTLAEIECVHGVTSKIQTQLNNKVGTTGSQNITGTKYFKSNVLLDSNAYANAAIQTQNDNTDGNHAAGIAFHNLGKNAAYLFLHPTKNSIFVVYADGTAYGINQQYSGTWSSRHVKENIKNMSIQEAEKILNINIVDFDYLNGQKNQHGIIAEDLYKILPDCVNMPGNYDEDNVEIEKTIMNTPSIDYLKLIPYLIKMLQIQQKQINDILNN